MAAKEIMLFFPDRIDVRSLFNDLVSTLALEIEQWPDEQQASARLSAKRGGGRSLLLLEFDPDGTPVIEDLVEWEQANPEFRRMLSECKPYLALHYRDISLARLAISELQKSFAFAADECIVENGEGCLLLLSSMFRCLNEDGDWSWERRAFPEMPEVGPSEWNEE